MRLITSPPSVNRLPRQCEILNNSQRYRPPLTGILYVDNIHTSQETHLCASTACYRDSFTFLYLYYLRTSRETHLCASTTCCGEGFTFLYVDDVRTSKETHLCAFKACYRDSFTFYMQAMFVPQRKHTCVTPRLVTGIVLLFYM
jgi:hypothetical protein